MPEKARLDVRHTDGKHGIVLANATFEWEAAPADARADDDGSSASGDAEAATDSADTPVAFKLANVNLNVPHGKLAVVLGRVRSCGRPPATRVIAHVTAIALDACDG